VTVVLFNAANDLVIEIVRVGRAQTVSASAIRHQLDDYDQMTDLSRAHCSCVLLLGSASGSAASWVPLKSLLDDYINSTHGR